MVLGNSYSTLLMVQLAALVLMLKVKKQIKEKEKAKKQNIFFIYNPPNR